jgi:hypothetical protein
MADGDGGPIRQFSLQTLLVCVGLISFLLAVLVTRPAYIAEAFVASLGLYLIYQSLYARPENWRGQVVIGVLICLVSLGACFYGPLQSARDANRQLREMREQLQKP